MTMLPLPRQFRLCALLIIVALACQSCATMRAVFDPPSDPLTAEEHLDLGLAYESEGRLEDASVQYEQASKEIPEALVLKGNVLFAMGELEEAAHAFEEATSALPESAEARNNLAWTLYQMDEDLEWAEELAVRALQLAGPANRETYQDTLDRIRAARSAQTD